MSPADGFCVACGAARRAEDRFCRACGHPAAEAPSPTPAAPARTAPPAQVSVPVPWKVGRAPRAPSIPSTGWGTRPPAGRGLPIVSRALLGCAVIVVGLGLLGLVGAYFSGDLTGALPTGSAGAAVPAATQPSRASEPTVPAATEPSRTAEPTAREMPLSDALAAGLVEMTAEGQNLQELSLTLTSLTDQPVDVVIPAGLIFLPASSATQSMVVIGSATVEVPAGESRSWTLDVACASMELDQPGSSDTFTIAAQETSAALLALLSTSSFAEAGFRVQQFAIWTITDDPAREGYVGLGTFGVGSGPSDEEMATIKQLFAQAGLDASRYRAFH